MKKYMKMKAPMNTKLLVLRHLEAHTLRPEDPMKLIFKTPMLMIGVNPWR